MGKLKHTVIDEINVKKSQKFLTLVMALESNVVVFRRRRSKSRDSPSVLKTAQKNQSKISGYGD